MCENTLPHLLPDATKSATSINVLGKGIHNALRDRACTGRSPAGEGVRTLVEVAHSLYVALSFYKFVLLTDVHVIIGSSIV